MLKILAQPFPVKTNSIAIGISLFAGLLVMAIFCLLKPFGLSQVNNITVFTVALKYMLATSLVSLLFTISLPNIFPRVFSECNWTVLHEMLSLVLLLFAISIANFYLSAYLFREELSVTMLLHVLGYTFAIGIIPVMLSVILKQRRLLQQYRQSASELEVMLDSNSHKFDIAEDVAPTEKADVTVQPMLLTLKGSNHAEELILAASDFLFAEAADNYTTIVYRSQDTIQKVQYRVTLKKLEEQTSTVTPIFRCHKSFLVNLENVIHISGNAQGYKLHISKHDAEIPVSRAFNPIIRERLMEQR